MLDAIKKRKEALSLLKQGCRGIKYDQSKADLIVQGISLLKSISEDDLFTKLVCAVGYEKISQFSNAIEHYNYCISSLPDSSLKCGIQGMKYRTIAKELSDSTFVKQSMECFKKAYEMETNPQWKKWWDVSHSEVKKMNEMK